LKGGKSINKKNNQIIAWMLEINSLIMWPGLLTQLDSIIFFINLFNQIYNRKNPKGVQTHGPEH